MTFPCAIIDSAALRHNLGVVRRLAPSSKVLAVIKANAYGHSLVPTARALSDADAYAVARLQEGLNLRAAAIDKEVVLLEGVFSRDELTAAAAQRLQIVVHTHEQLQMLEQARDLSGLSAWLKVDTGMNRLGFRPEDFSSAWAQLQNCQCVETRRVMTHLAFADDRADPRTQQQISMFARLLQGIGVEQSIANSAGLIAWPNSRVHWVRPGLMLYGISPLLDIDARELGLTPAMTLVTQLIAIRTVAAGETVGYGGTWRAVMASRIGIAAVGYGDGYPRSIHAGAPVLLGEQLVPIVGRVSMDMIGIDLNAVPEARVGDTVVLWGDGLPVERIASFAETIPYELVCGISQRVAVDWQ